MISVVRPMINVQQYREFNWGPVCHSIVGGQAYRHPVSDVVAVTHRTLSLTAFPFMKLRVTVTNGLLAETGALAAEVGAALETMFRRILILALPLCWVLAQEW
jgi:hypothetical protein